MTKFNKEACEKKLAQARLEFMLAAEHLEIAMDEAKLLDADSSHESHLDELRAAMVRAHYKIDILINRIERHTLKKFEFDGLLPPPHFAPSNLTISV